MDDEFADEARERWGHTEAYRQSARRTATYTADDWAEVEAEAAALQAGFAALMATGVAPEAASAMDLAERHRAHISKWFYDCGPSLHAALGQMYVADARFTHAIDATAPGLARFMAAAFTADERLRS
jgi:hypothetical protein